MLPPVQLPSLTGHHLLPVWHSHTVWIRMRIELLLLLEIAAQALLLRDWTIFVLEQQSLEADYLFSKTLYLSGQIVILTAEYFDFGL